MGGLARVGRSRRECSQPVSIRSVGRVEQGNSQKKNSSDPQTGAVVRKAVYQYHPPLKSAFSNSSYLAETSRRATTASDPDERFFDLSRFSASICEFSASFFAAASWF